MLLVALKEAVLKGCQTETMMMTTIHQREVELKSNEGDCYLIIIFKDCQRNDKSTLL